MPAVRRGGSHGAGDGLLQQSEASLLSASATLAPNRKPDFGISFDQHGSHDLEQLGAPQHVLGVGLLEVRVHDSSDFERSGKPSDALWARGDAL